MIRATVTEIYDMNTHIGALGLIGIHTPKTDLLFKHLSGLFTQFKRWKYNGARFSLIPAAQLPQDVAGVTVGGGEQAVDPRDVFNPILHKGFTGESLGAFLDKYLDPGSQRGPSLDYTIGESGNIIPDTEDQEKAYYQMLTQGGFKKMAPMGAIRNQKIYPMVYDLATTRQLSASWAGTWGPQNSPYLNDPWSELDSAEQVDTDQSQLSPSALRGAPSANSQFGNVQVGSVRFGEGGQFISSTYFERDPTFITPRKMKLGWMDTLQRVLPAASLSEAPEYGGEPYTFAQLPKLYEYLIITPPSYFSKLYYRLVLQHEVWFSGLRSATGASNALPSKDVEYYNYMEQLPTEAAAASIDVLNGEVTPVTDGMAGSIV